MIFIRLRTYLNLSNQIIQFLLYDGNNIITIYLIINVANIFKC